MGGLQYLCLTFIFTILTDSIVSECPLGYEVNWVDITHPSEVVSLMPEPAGWYGAADVFVCLGYADQYDWWQTGGLFIQNDGVHCMIHQTVVARSPKYQMLNVPKGTVGWVPYDNDVIGNAVRAGVNTVPLYICRVNYEGNLLVGTIALTASPNCYVSTPDLKVIRTTGETDEILAVTAYGMKYFKDKCYVK